MSGVETNDRVIGPYRGAVAAAFETPAWLAQLAAVGGRLQAEAGSDRRSVRNRTAVLSVTADGHTVRWHVKAFGCQNAVKDRLDRRRGSKARRTWAAACRLQAHGVGVPPPVACLEAWSGNRLSESYFVSEYLPHMTSFRDELVRLFRHDPDCGKLMALLQTVAGAVRGMHEAGFLHRDLGNQNILLSPEANGRWAEVRFADLNRGRFADGLSPRERGRDLSRIALPSDLRRIFFDMYWQAVPPDAFTRWERRYRAWFGWHTRTRPWRHPLRERRARRRTAQRETMPSARDLWIWDRRSAQPIVTMRPRERHRYYPRDRGPHLAAACLATALPLRRRYRALLKTAFESPVTMRGRVGMGIDAGGDASSARLALLDELDAELPVLVRMYHHEGEADRKRRLAAVRELHRGGHPVALALIQDRVAVTDLDRWECFLREVLDAAASQVEWVELGHAVNRVKWGVWGFGEYRAFMRRTAAVVRDYPGIRVMGPAVIDFDLPFLAAALRVVRGVLPLQALSHLLYVDRRGAPENRQGAYATLEKAAWMRAAAGTARGCEDRLIVSEVNWPLAGTGIDSPVGSPYVSPGVRRNDPSVDEIDYAAYMIRYLLMTLCSGFAERVYWWRLAARGFGLVDDGAPDPQTWRRRPAFDALRTFLQAVGNATFRARQSTPDGRHVYVFENVSGARVAVAYCESGQGRVDIPFTPAVVRDMVGRTVDAAAGRADAVDVSGQPCYCLERE